MNHFKAHMMFSSERRRFQSIQDDNLVKALWWKKSKMANAMLNVLDGFPLDVLMYRRSKFTCFQVTLNCLIPTQVVLTILLYIDHSSRCALNVAAHNNCIITYIKEKTLHNINIFREISKLMKIKRLSKIYVRISTTLIHISKFKI